MAAICMDYGVKRKVVSDVWKWKSVLQEYPLSVDMEGTNSYTKGGPMKQLTAAKQVNVGEAVMMLFTATFMQ